MNQRLCQSRWLPALLCAAFTLRALTPLGYMPAPANSGLLFELCPDGLPADVVQRILGGGHNHHHQHGDNIAKSESPDRCPLGHLLCSVFAAGDIAGLELSQARADLIVPEVFVSAGKRHERFHARDPPA